MNIQSLELIAIALLTFACLYFFFSLDIERRRTTVLHDIIEDAEMVLGHGIMGSTTELKEFLERHGFSDPRSPSEVHFTIHEDDELNCFLNLSVDMNNGRSNMDLALHWSNMLDNILLRLKKGDGDPSQVRGVEVTDFAEIKTFTLYLGLLHRKWNVVVFKDATLADRVHYDRLIKLDILDK